MDKLKQKVKEVFSGKSFDSLAVAAMDFKKKSFAAVEFYQGHLSEQFHFFDLASLTKPLTLTLAYLKSPKTFDEQMHGLLHHQGGLLAHGRLSKGSWREEILQLPVRKSPTLYSDYGALRLMLEWEKKNKKGLWEFVQEDWAKEVCFWKELDHPKQSPCTGKRNGKEIRGEVHDDNAHVIGEFCSHAGLFATLPGACQSLLQIEERYQMIARVKEALDSGEYGRFVFGLDRVSDEKDSLAGPGCSAFTFGHLGFTGTSFWIDPISFKGHVILSNATQNYWHERKELNDLRKEIGEFIWKSEGLC